MPLKFPDEKIKKILVRAPNWLGDAIMALPTVIAIREEYSHAHLTVAVKPNLSAVYDGAADRLLSLQRGVAGVKGALTLRREKFDLGILLTNSFSSAAWLASVGARCRVGYARDARGWMLTNTVACTPALLAAHQSAYYAGLLPAVGVNRAISAPRLWVTDETVNECAKFLVENRLVGHPYAVIAPCSAFGSVKDWGLSNYLAVAKQIKKNLRLTTALIGTAAQASQLAAIADGKNIINSAGGLSLGALFAFLRGAKVFVGGDSGATHAAAALGAPTVALFGVTDPSRTRPLGDEQKIRVISPMIDKGAKFKLNSRSAAKVARTALDAISVEEVFSAIIDVISSK